MRTAEEILKSHYFRRDDPETDIDELVRIINEARIETIRECAELSNSKRLPSLITKQSILKLIDQVK